MVLLLLTYVLPLACRRNLLQASGTRTPLHSLHAFSICIFNAERTCRIQRSAECASRLRIIPRRLKSGCDFALNYGAREETFHSFYYCVLSNYYVVLSNYYYVLSNYYFNISN